MNAICREVKRFLKELGRDLPDIFSYRPPARQFADPLILKAPPSRPPTTATRKNYIVPSCLGQNGAPRPPVEINRKQAGDIIRARVKYLGAALGLEYGKSFIKDQKTL